MKLKKIVHEMGEFKLSYLLDEESGHISMYMLPQGVEDVYEERRSKLGIPEMVELGMDEDAWAVGGLCHLSLQELPQSKGAGQTLKYGEAMKRLKYISQEVEKTEDSTIVATVLQADDMYKVIHYVKHRGAEVGVTVWCEFKNTSEKNLTLDLITSVALDNLTPMRKDDNQDNLVLHRFFGGWSIEGKHQELFMEDMNMERSWNGAFPESERFGSVGSYPVDRYFPMAAIEDREANVFWGIQLESASSWQMEVSRNDDCHSFSAGIADVAFGGWFKTIGENENFTTQKAYVSVARDDVKVVCNQLLEMHHKEVDTQPESEWSLPIVFNDWCASYGEPNHEKTLSYARLLEGTPVKYVVIDAGWTDSQEKSFGQGGNGDWVFSKKKFPKGLKATSREVKELGFVLGIWFEMEVTTQGALVYGEAFDHLHIKKNGNIVNSGGDRTFWDFTCPETIAYLDEKIIKFLNDNEIGYLKVDYNSSIGIGCDGAESMGEGLRLQMQAVLAFFKRIREKVPNIVIENCASGGHRLEVGFMNTTAMSSFSDAHECKELPCVAANLQHLVLGRQNQIWVVLNERLSKNEINYRLSSGFLGRFCLSGNIDKLSQEKWEVALHAMSVYEKVTDLIKYARAEVWRSEFKNLHHPKGYQVVKRVLDNQMLLVVHCFEDRSEIQIDIKESGYQIADIVGYKEKVKMVDGKIFITDIHDMEGMVLRLTK